MVDHCLLRHFLDCNLLHPVHSDDKPIKLGVMFISSGPLGGYGKNVGRPVEMAIGEINDPGGVHGRKLTATFGDTKLKPVVAAELAEKFITQDEVDFLLGPTSSGVISALSKVSRTHKKNPH